MLSTCCMQLGCGSPAAGSKHQQARPPQQLRSVFYCRLTKCSLHLLLVCLAAIFILICIQLNENRFCHLYPVLSSRVQKSKVCSLIAHCLCGIMKTCSRVRGLLRTYRHGGKHDKEENMIMTGSSTVTLLYSTLL